MKRQLTPTDYYCHRLQDHSIILASPFPLSAERQNDPLRPSLLGAMIPKTIYSDDLFPRLLAVYSEMKVASLKRIPSSTVSVSPIFSLRVTLCCLGMYCGLISEKFRRRGIGQDGRSSYLVDVRLCARSAGDDLLYKTGHFGHHVNLVQALLKVRLQQSHDGLPIFGRAAPVSLDGLRLWP